MNRPGISKKFAIKSKKANMVVLDDYEGLSFQEVKKDSNKKRFRNYENALRSKDISRLLSYEDDYE